MIVELPAYLLRKDSHSLLPPNLPSICLLRGFGRTPFATRMRNKTEGGGAPLNIRGEEIGLLLERKRTSLLFIFVLLSGLWKAVRVLLSASPYEF